MPRRLDAIVELVPGRGTVVDVGYDHGKLIKKLVLRSQDQRVIGIDRQAEAADRFWATRWKKIHAAKARISLRKGDGLQPVKPGEAAIAVFAGLSQGNTTRMLRNHRGTLAGFQRMIFCPIDHTAHLIPFLEKNQWHVAAERLAFDHRRFYHTFAVEKGERREDPVTRFFGPRLFEEMNPYLYHFLLQQRKILEPVMAVREKQRDSLQELCNTIDLAIERARGFAAEKTHE